MSDTNHSVTQDRVIADIQALIQTGVNAKDFLRKIVAECWGELPTYSTLQHPEIKEVATATVGVGAVLTFRENGMQKVVLLQSGGHYREQGKRMIPGGFMKLGVADKENSVKPESPREGCAREIGEELKDESGNPLLTIAPERMKPMDAQTIQLPWGETRLVMGMMVELTAEEVTKVKQHVIRLQTDEPYRQKVMAHTVNGDSKKPEVSNIEIVPVKDLLREPDKLLHADQMALFERVQEHFSSSRARA